VLWTNAKVTDTISIDDLEVEDVNSFIYLGAIVHGAVGSHEDISCRLSIARRAYAPLNPVWRSRTYSKHTKLRIFKSCVISTLLYGAEMWRVTSTDMERLDIFHRKCLRRILGIFWPYTISNCELYERAREGPISETLKVRRWRWIGHVLRRENDNNCRVALTWMPEVLFPKWERVFHRGVQTPRNKWRHEAFIVSRFLDAPMKHKAGVLEIVLLGSLLKK